MNRRDFLLTSAVSAAFSTPIHAQGARLRRALPRSRESLPAIGMGTWLTFDVGDEAQPRAQRREVLRRFFAAGGGVIDSSPMYGRSEQLLGELLAELPHDGRLFTSTKVWTIFDRVGPRQLEESLRLWRVPRFDLLLVHNLLNWEAHLKTLRVWKEAGRVRYIGVSTSHGRKHAEIQRVMREQPIDAIQITYNLADASALPVLDLAAERGIGVFINRPFDGGMLFNAVGARAVPPWAAEFDCTNWAQFFLKWILGHPAVTSAIPATTQPAHMDENMSAGLGRLPDATARRRMSSFFDGL
jgi:aryl-alcohol dehydrogenase-like predicted oxidoreductase